MLTKIRINKISRIITSRFYCKSSSDKNNEINKQGIKQQQNDFVNDNSSDHRNPFKRTLGILGGDMKKIKNFFTPKTIAEEEDVIAPYMNNDIFPTHCDVVIIGGGAIGSSIAYWLKKRARNGLNVVVVEKDSTYCKASTVLSVGGLRQQFSLEENIQMSLFGAEFLRNIKHHLGEDVEINFTPHGYLMLSSEETAQNLIQNSKLQNELGANNEILTAEKLKKKFPWLNTDGIAVGCHGLEKEGWFDPWALLMGLKRRAIEYGAHYVEGEASEFKFRHEPDINMQGVEFGTYNGIEKLEVTLKNNEKREIKFALCIIAAGASSGEVAKLAKIGVGKNLLSLPLPIEPRKRYVYVFDSQNDSSPGLNTPLTIDPSNTYFRREGLTGLYLCGRSPSPDKEPSVENLDVDLNYFETDVWPQLAHRVPSFDAIKVKSSWAGYYEYNTFDENGIIGTYPYYNNLYIASGFSGHGIQHSPAVGRGVAELIIDGHFRTIDLTRLNFDRIVVDSPMREVNIV